MVSMAASTVESACVQVIEILSDGEPEAPYGCLHPGQFFCYRATSSNCTRSLQADSSGLQRNITGVTLLVLHGVYSCACPQPSLIPVEGVVCVTIISGLTGP